MKYVSFLFILINITTWAQKHTYLFPINPCQTNLLSGTMGEIRPDHFHAGIDIKTNGREGLTVYAAQDGFIYRIKILEKSYGNVLYIKHPNGHTTVYAHLKSFKKEIAEWVRKKQYEQQTFTIELSPEKNQFPVKRGDIIGSSGNTGSSGGPHLHFEIRDKRNHPINPLHYFLKNIKDNIAPTVNKIAFITLNKDARINGQFGRFEFDLVKNKNNVYTLRNALNLTGNIGVEVNAFDRLNGAANRNGVPYIDVWLNGKQVFKQHIKSFSFKETYDVKTHYNYKAKQLTSKTFDKLYVDSDNLLRFYKMQKNKGILLFDSTEKKNYHIRIDLKDAHQNKSKIQLYGKVASTNDLLVQEANDHVTTEVWGDFLQISLNTSYDSILTIYANHMKYLEQPAFKSTYIWDFKEGIPDSASFAGRTIYFDFLMQIPLQDITYFNQFVHIHFDKKSLFTPLYLTIKRYEQNKKEYFKINDNTIPIRKNITVALKPKYNYNGQKAAAYLQESARKLVFLGGEWKSNLLSFETKQLGKFVILEDTVKPSIKPIKVTSEELIFSIDDDISGIGDIEMKVNGKWVLMHYDYKTKKIWSEKLNSDIPFKGNMTLKVYDKMKNLNIFTKKL